MIRILDSVTIDKIAAGEVVEKPVNVVKELVENAIDSGANGIAVEIKDGGTSVIRITDNGCGIPAEEVKTAFLRHATSKLNCAEDLSHIASLGFRGEALASIAAVSMVEMITKTKDSLMATRYRIEGGVEGALESIGAPDGTTIIVRNLFYNIPARKKFLKSAQTEASYIIEMMQHLALSHPEISFKMTVNSQTKFHTSGNHDQKEIIYRIYGREFSDELIPVSYESNGLLIEGYLGKPEINRSNRNFENYFVNKRYVRSDFIAKGIEEGYRTFLMQHRFPFCVLNFQIDSSFTDVNVHPAKMEIRFQNQIHLYDEIVKLVYQSLSTKELIPTVSVEEPDKKAETAVPSKEKGPEPFEFKRIEKASLASPQANHDLEAKESLRQLISSMEPKRNTDSVLIFSSEHTTIDPKDNIHANVIKHKETITNENPIQMNLFEDKMLSPESRRNYHILGQLFQTYWLIEFGDKLFIMDQHAAHEKVLYEKIYKRVMSETPASQVINPPIIVSLSASEAQLLISHQNAFSLVGFETEEFGGGEYTLRTVPMELYGTDPRSFFLEMMNTLSLEYQTMPTENSIVLQRIASMACKAAVKGNMKLSMNEVNALIDDLLACENPYHCPHGRPTLISMSKYEIEKKFKRIL